MPSSDDSRLDSELEASFPASDPPSITQPVPPDRPAGIDRKPVLRDQFIGLAILVGVLIAARALGRRRRI